MDLRLLEVFVAVYRARSVSAAAVAIGIAQPTVSIRLRKLRQLTGDPLFVRTSSGMDPTPRADALFGPISDALATLQSTLDQSASFDPSTSDRRFRLCVSDSSQMVLIPQLLNHLKAVAPRIGIEVQPMTLDTPRLLESGGADLAIGHLPQLEAGFYQQRLFEQEFVCLVRKDHPRIEQTLSSKQFRSESHVQITLPGAGGKGTRDAYAGLRVAVKMPSFLGVSLLVAHTDLIATVPARLASVLALSEPARVRMVKSPLKLAPYLVRQHWHARYDRDPQNRWLRQAIAGLFTVPTASRSAGGRVRVGR